MDASLVQVVATSRDLVLEAYRIAARHGGAPRDWLFVALALRSGLDLKPQDRRQSRMMDAERAGRIDRVPGKGAIA